MAKLLLDVENNNRVIRNIKDARIFPAEWYVKEDFPNWDIVEVAGTPAQVDEGAEVETARAEDPEAEDQSTYWKDGSTWYKVEVEDFDHIYDAASDSVINAVGTHSENRVESVTQEYIDSLEA
tara:strand:+ start:247 stop:615 length:369 start_codon:yes stop_codon:yes gene_type:complete